MDLFYPPTAPTPSFDLTVERTMAVSPDALYRAWTEEFDRWFAAPGSVLMKPEIDVPFFFVTGFEGNYHPHYGRFLRLTPARLIELTWLTGTGGTAGVETTVTVELTPAGDQRTHVRLTHAGFSEEKLRDGSEQAWPLVLEQQEQRLTGR